MFELANTRHLSFWARGDASHQ